MLFDIGAIWYRGGGALDRDALKSFADAMGCPEHLSKTPRDQNWAVLTSDQASRQSGTVEAVADSHLHNQPYLSKVLAEHDSNGRNDKTDNDIMRRSYGLWGNRFFEHLVGDFAVCLFDQQQQLLLVARDRLGCKPLYYAEHQGYVLVCSLIKPILDCGLVPDTIYQPRLADHIVLRSESSEPERTFYQHVYRVLPAHRTLFRREATSTQRYGSLSLPEPLYLKSNAEYEEAFLAELDSAVRRSINGSGTVASMLSGGVDSSAVSAIANRCSSNGSSIITLSAVTCPKQMAGCVETRSIQCAAEHIGSKNFTITPSRFSELVGDLSDDFNHSTNMFDSLMMNTSLAVMKLARSQNVDVLLDGLDGGLVAGFAGGSPLKQRILAKQFSSANRELQRLSRITKAGTGPVFWRFFLRGMLGKIIPSPLMNHYNTQRNQHYYESYILSSGINPDFARSVDLLDRLISVEQGLVGDSSLSHAEQHAQRIQHPSLLMAIERYERVARRHGIESRHPLLDISFIEFCLSLPPELKDDGYLNKPLMRRSLQSLLPDAINHRPYSPSDHLAPKYISAWLNNNPQFDQNLSDASLTLASFFNKDALTSLQNSPSLGENGLYLSTIYFMLWSQSRRIDSAFIGRK